MQNYIELYKNYQRFCSVLAGGLEVQVVHIKNIKNWVWYFRVTQLRTSNEAVII
jgi:hypothetical protein